MHKKPNQSTSTTDSLSLTADTAIIKQASLEFPSSQPSSSASLIAFLNQSKSSPQLNEDSEEDIESNENSEDEDIEEMDEDKTLDYYIDLLYEKGKLTETQFNNLSEDGKIILDDKCTADLVFNGTYSCEELLELQKNKHAITAIQDPNISPLIGSKLTKEDIKNLNKPTLNNLLETNILGLFTAGHLTLAQVGELTPNASLAFEYSFIHELFTSNEKKITFNQLQHLTDQEYENLIDIEEDLNILAQITNNQKTFAEALLEVCKISVSNRPLEFERQPSFRP